MPVPGDPARLALKLAALGWHILPLSAASKRPLGNCPACRPSRAPPPTFRRLPLPGRGGWCHGVRAATTDPARSPPGGSATRRRPRRGRRPLRPGPHRHRRPWQPPPASPGHRPAARHRPGRRTHSPAPWDDPDRFRDGRDTLTCWPGSAAAPAPGRRPRVPARHRQDPIRRRPPVVPGTRRRAPPGPRRPHGRYGLAWQVDIKAGWSYGVAPRRQHHTGTYHLAAATRPARPMPGGSPREITRVTAAHRPARLPALDAARRRPARPPTCHRHRPRCRPARRYRRRPQRALSALAYHAGGLLDGPAPTTARWPANSSTPVHSGLSASIATRIVHRAIANGIHRPVTPPGSRV